MSQPGAGSEPGYSAGYGTAPPPGSQARGTEAYAPPGSGYGREPLGPEAPGGHGAPKPARATGPNPGATIGWVGLGLAFVLGFIGIVLGAISISRSRRAGASPLIGIVAVVVGVLQVLAIIVTVLLTLMLRLAGGIANENPGDTPTPRTVAVTELAVGNCLDLDTLAGPDVEQLPCAEEHDAEVIAFVTFTGTAYPGETDLQSDAIDRCYDSVAAAVPPRVDPQHLLVDALIPTQEEWDAGSRRAACLLATEREMTGSATAGDLVVAIN